MRALEIITGHVIYNPAYTYKFQLKTTKHEKVIKELKKRRNKELEPSITTFMVKHNISDINAGQGKIKCTPRNTKQTLNKGYIEENLKKVIKDDSVIEQAMSNILNNREIKTTYKLQVAKK